MDSGAGTGVVGEVGKTLATDFLGSTRIKKAGRSAHGERRSCFKQVAEKGNSGPQGLKPDCLGASGGTAKAVLSGGSKVN